MRTIDYIIIHCSATREDRSLAVEELETIHRRRGFRGIGYHYYIRRDGIKQINSEIGDKYKEILCRN